MNSKLLLSILLCLLIVSGGLAQEKENYRVDLDMDHATIESFARAVESQVPCRFYFDPKIFAGYTISLHVKQRNLSLVLKQLFEGTPYRFAISDSMDIFLTEEVPIVLDPAWKQAPGTFLYDSAAYAGEIAIDHKLYTIGIRTNKIREGNSILRGRLLDDKTGATLKGGLIRVDNDQKGIPVPASGHYEISLSNGKHILYIQSYDKTTLRREVMVYGNGNLDFALQDEVKVLQEVIISARRNRIINRPQMGVERLTPKIIREIPSVFGEADLVKVLLTLPGVKTVGEGSSGFNVRGGAADQNLILFNDATIYNPSHFFGFFSAFNPELVKDVELYKSSIPAKFGGRLSSVLNITAKEGNKSKLTGSAGIGPVTTRLNLEGPIVKDKTSFVLGGRTSYSNWILKALPDNAEFQGSRVSFFDINAGVHHIAGPVDELQLTAYYSRDKFNLNSDTLFGYSNTNISMKWKHNFSRKLIGTFTTGIDNYNYFNKSENNPVNAYKMSFDIRQLNLKTDFTYNYNNDLQMAFGFSSIHYLLHPGKMEPNHSGSQVVYNDMPSEKGVESALYGSGKYDISDAVSLEGGIRFSMFNYLGAKEVNYYRAGVPRDEASKFESRQYGAGEFIKTYGGPEIRAAARFTLADNFSLKAGFNSLRQYIHMLSNTTAISPTDIWKLSDPNIKPQSGSQYSLGLYKTFKGDSLELSLEVYYKKINNYLDYKSGATLVMNETIETDVMNTEGKAYGAELLIRKRMGRLNGWISYTYSRTLLRMDDPTQGMIVNRGEFYPSGYDKPHDITVVGNYRVNRRFSVALNLVYNTGRPITLPIGTYYYSGSERPLYSDRNAYRIPDYFRADFSMNIEGNHKVKQKTHNSWTIGLYNLTGRKNPYSVYFTSEDGVVKGYKLFVFGNVIPFINFNIRF